MELINLPFMSKIPLLIGSTQITSGNGAPTIGATKGSIYIRLDGSSATTRLYINTDGQTAWTSVTTAT